MTVLPAAPEAAATAGGAGTFLAGVTVGSVLITGAMFVVVGGGAYILANQWGQLNKALADQAAAAAESARLDALLMQVTLARLNAQLAASAREWSGEDLENISNMLDDLEFYKQMFNTGETPGGAPLPPNIDMPTLWQRMLVLMETLWSSYKIGFDQNPLPPIGPWR
jgi:hypothetical protein